MAYTLDGTDIVIAGWDKGISDNPYTGINDMRGVNITSVPGEVSVSFAQKNIAPPSCSATVTSVDTGADTLTVNIVSGSLQGYQAVTFASSITLPSPLVAGTPYWIAGLTGSTFSLVSDPIQQTAVDLTTTGSGTITMTTIDMDVIKTYEKNDNTNINRKGIALDAKGRCWYNSGTKYTYMGNLITGNYGGSYNVGNGIVYYQGYLLVFANSRISYFNYATNTWNYMWDPAQAAVNKDNNCFTTTRSQGYSHEALVPKNSPYIYIADGYNLVQLQPKVNSVTGQIIPFDPLDASTYIWNLYAVQLPSTEVINCLEELGDNILMGGNSNCIYPWDRVSLQVGAVIKIADTYIRDLLTVNTNTYIFAGNRGRIYVTNGNQANEFFKVPDHICGKIEPAIIINNSCYNKNKIAFGVSATDNNGTVIQSYNGLWTIDLDSNACHCLNVQSTPAAVTAIYAYPITSDNTIIHGFGFVTAWTTGSVQGIDIAYSTGAPTTDYSAYIETDLVPVGTFLNKRTFGGIEFKLSHPLLSGEGVRISYRYNKDASYTVVGETLGTADINPLSDFYIVNFDQSQWLQLKIELKSITSNPSYTRLTEVRLKSNQQQ